MGNSFDLENNDMTLDNVCGGSACTLYSTLDVYDHNYSIYVWDVRNSSESDAAHEVVHVHILTDTTYTCMKKMIL